MSTEQTLPQIELTDQLAIALGDARRVEEEAKARLLARLGHMIGIGLPLVTPADWSRLETLYREHDAAHRAFRQASAAYLGALAAR